MSGAFGKLTPALATQAPPALAMRDLAWRRGGLAELSLSVAPGACLAVVGGAGAGKSALLALLAGLARPDRGEVLADGVAVTGQPAHRRGFGVVLQGANLFDHLTLARNLAFSGGDVGAALAAFGLGRRAAYRPGELTTAERAGAALARAMATWPRVLLLDEPFAGCTADERRGLAADLARLRQTRPVCVVIATRAAADARQLAAETIAVLARGHVAQVGAPTLLYERPAGPEVARAMGAVNCLRGTLRAVEDDVAIVTLPGGTAVEAGFTEGLSIGDPCQVMVRPERIAIAAVAAVEFGDGAISAELRAVDDMGAHVRLRLSAGADIIEVIRPAGASLAGLRPGAAVALAWQAQHAWVFPA